MGALNGAAARRLASATAHHQAGRLAEALAAYLALIAAHPAQAELRYRAGVALMALRRFDEAEEQLAKAVILEPAQPAAWLSLGLARREMLRHEEALEALAKARALDPAIPQVNGQMGLVLRELGRLDEALDRVTEETRRYPGVARNHNNLGTTLLAFGRERDAEAAFLEAVRVDRNYATAYGNLAGLLQKRGELAGAEAAWREAARVVPTDTRALQQLGLVLTSRWRPAEAEPFLRRACELAPENPEPARLLAYVLKRLNRAEEAREVARGILARDGADLQAAVVEALALPAVPESAEALARARETYAKGLESLLAREALFARNAAQVLKLQSENFHLAYQGGDDRELQAKYAGFLARLGARAEPRYYEPRAKRGIPPEARIRVGFLSGFFRDCTAGKYFRSWAAGLDRTRFEVFVYYTAYIRDAFSEALAKEIEHHRHIVDTVPRIADVVLADGLDILVHPEVGMDTSSYLLAGMRLAPVQLAGWGHPVTTGQGAIDAFITCAAMEPEGAQAHYTEHLERLPGIGTRYARPGPASDKSRADLGLPPEGTLYLCPQSLFKVHPDNDALFARVLASDPAGRLVFFEDQDPPLTRDFRARLGRALAAKGVSEARAVFLGRAGHADYLRVNALADVMLDTLHWSGGNTSLDAIAMGLPVVTLPGAFMRGRQSAGMLGLAGVPELIAKDAEDYVRLAVRLGTDAPWRAEVRARLAAGAPRLFDDPAPVEALARLLEGLARPRD
ncbi:MAG: tetratricopeptide repeat protein [Betaproteobacteria bacterium]|nr:tetratricopeptide repeat protein [Betaproteobacteria bacterium]